MYEVVGIKFDLSNDIYYFSSNKIELKQGDKVIVDSDQTINYGTCVTNVFKEKEENLYFPLKKVLRIVNDEDKKIINSNKNSADLALAFAKKTAKNLNLKMNFVSSNYTYDKNQLYFTFTSEERVDFRELAKKLAQKYKTRIELRQIGVRDKAKLIGGIGPCGLFLCCNSFLSDFNSVSINMAKNQFLALNPSKINGVCGRLLCCLNYEDDIYTDLKKSMPKIGEILTTKSGKGKVVSVDIFKRKYELEIDKNNKIEVNVE